MIPRRFLNYLRTKYVAYLSSRCDIGLQYDPPHSLADLFTRHLYARLFRAASLLFYRKGDGPPRSFVDRLTRHLYVRLFRGTFMQFYLKQAIRKLKLGALPIRIVFLAQDPLDWLSLDSLYRACRSDPLFKTFVVNIGFAYGKDYVTDCSTLFRQNNVEFLDGMNNRFRLDLLNPDIVAISSPYDECRPHHYGTANLLRFGEILYICYGPDFADKDGKFAKPFFGNAAQKQAWRIFSRSNRTIGQYQKHGNIPPRRIVCLGHPRIDQYYSGIAGNPLPEVIASASVGKFKIIYAPHHTLEGWSTFLKNADAIRRFLQENEDCYLVFRPHPLLMNSLKQANIMSNEDFRSYFAGDRCCLYDGNNYYGLFRWSDVLISDVSSFLVEYAPTRKPTIYLHREDGWGMDETLRDDVFNSCYVARSENEILAQLQQLKNGHDPLRGKREPYQENMNVGMFSGGAGKRIAAYLKDKLA